MRLILALSAVLVLVLGTSVAANPCATVSPGTGVKTLNGAVATFYVDHRTAFDVWIYEEHNTVGGLQRGGCSYYVSTLSCDPCVDNTQVPPDRLII